MDLGIANKVALVLGGSKGIGRAIAIELAQAGAKVVVVARGQQAIDETVAQVKMLGGEAMGISADLLDLSSYESVVDQCIASFGSPDIAVYNMDAPPPGQFDDVDEQMLADAYHMVVLCYSRMLRHVLPTMKQKQWGRIVTIGSGTSKQLVRSSLNFGYTLANATRGAASSLAKTVAAEVAPFGITINTIGTGFIDTEQSRRWSEDRAVENAIDTDAFVAGMVSHIPVGRRGTVDEMAALCAYLCSQRASFTTGETILCDGGMTNCIV